MLIIRSFSYALQSLNNNICLKKLIVQNGILNEGLASDGSVRNWKYNIFFKSVCKVYVTEIFEMRDDWIVKDYKPVQNPVKYLR